MTQLALPIVRSITVGAALPVPFPLPWRKVRRSMRRKLQALPSEIAIADRADTVIEWAEAQALFEQINRGIRRRSRTVTGRNSARGLALYAATAEGRRAAKSMQILTERITVEGVRLCA